MQRQCKYPMPITMCVASALLALLLVLCLAPRPAAPAADPSRAIPYEAACSAHQGCQAFQGDCCPNAAGLLMGCCTSIPSVAELDAFHGMCYTPAPTKEAGKLPTDDFMGSWARGLWGPLPGRDDLATIRQLGATLVRLYGNDPRLAHKEFLYRAADLALGVIVAFSDFPFIEEGGSKCALAPPYNCKAAIFDQYSKMLLHGLTEDRGDGTRQYHRAVKGIILMNEPELKVSFNGINNQESRSQGYYTKVLITALDGALQAEAELQVVPDATGGLPPFTITHSFDSCEQCLASQRGNTAGGTSVGQMVALAFMFDFALATLRPGLYGYPSPSRDLRAALQNRFAFGFNTQDRADVICERLLGPFQGTPLAGVPVYAGEYKPWYMSLPDQDTQAFSDDLAVVKGFVDGTGTCAGHSGKSLLRGVAVFEFQVSYWKGPGDHQMDYGIYDLGNSSLGRTEKVEATGWKDFPVWCLRQKRNQAGDSWPGAVANVFGGSVPDDSSCQQQQTRRHPDQPHEQQQSVLRQQPGSSPSSGASPAPSAVRLNASALNADNPSLPGLSVAPAAAAEALRAPLAFLPLPPSDSSAAAAEEVPSRVSPADPPGLALLSAPSVAKGELSAGVHSQNAGASQTALPHRSPATVAAATAATDEALAV